MRTYLINYFAYDTKNHKFDASVARMDATEIMGQMGISHYDMQTKFSVKNKILNSALKFATDCPQYFKISSKLKESNVIFQYPILTFTFPVLYKLLRERKNKIYFLVHDLDGIRYDFNTDRLKSEVRNLNMADGVIVHTPQMKELLCRNGLTTKVVVLGVFDYLAESVPPPAADNLIEIKNTVAFAGNLNKSVFLQKLDKSEITNDIKIDLYGGKPSWTLTNPHIHYIQRFSPKNVSAIKAGWGLVWDGEEIGTCSGSLGNYLRYISPHKLSLYLAAGIPVIVWNESAQASFVAKENVGITVSSIQDAFKVINDLDATDYLLKAKNAQRIGSKLKQGDYLKKAIETVLE